MPRKRTLALIAHDSRKPTLVRWARDHLDLLRRLDLYATEATGARLEMECGLAVTRLRSGPMGGDQQIGAKITAGEIDGIVFLWDPLLPHSHDADLHALLRIAVVYDVPLACNLASARVMIRAFAAP